MTDKAEFERLLDVYGFRCERFGQDLSTHARAQVVSAFAALASAPVAELRLEWSAKALYDAIKDVLLNHRLSNLVDEDGEFFPLVDHLCSQDDQTTESGEFEIALICDAIYNDVLTKSAPVADERAAVAYLDLGAGGYMDVGTDLTDEQLAALPKGRHMLAIIGTHGVDGYTPASAPVAGEAQPLGYVMKGREWPDQCYYPSSHKPTDIHNWTPVFDHAAPQASAEDVRNAALVPHRQEWANRGDGYGHWVDVDEARFAVLAPECRRTLYLPQADKDGGQQRAGDDLPAFMQSRMTPWGLLVRAGRIILGTTLMDMSKALGMRPSELSAYECDRQRLTDDVILAVMRFFDERGLCIPATAWRKAALSAPQAEQGERDA